MARNLIDLIKASGQAAISGQNFGGNVAGAEVGTKMTDYLITGVSFSGHPVPGPTYASPATFNIVATFTRGAKAQFIQRNTANAWQFVQLGGNEADISITSFTANSGGASHDIALRVSVKQVGSQHAVTPSVLHVGTAPQGTQPHPVRWYAEISPGAATPVTIGLEAAYDPDSANFNTELSNMDSPWSDLSFTRALYTAGDYEVEWHYGAGMIRADWKDPYDINVAPTWDESSRMATGLEFGFQESFDQLQFGKYVYPDTDPEYSDGTEGYQFGTRPGGRGIAWVRWRGVGQPTWNYPVQPGHPGYPGRFFITDTRATQ
jgi:hypothetical protein